MIYEHYTYKDYNFGRYLHVIKRIKTRKENHNVLEYKLNVLNLLRKLTVRQRINKKNNGNNNKYIIVY